MVNHKLMRALTAVLAPLCAFGAILSPRTALAWEEGEPINNNNPAGSNFSRPVSVYHGAPSLIVEWGTFQRIAVDGDVDYHLMSCGGGLPIEYVEMYPTRDGDLDIAVYRLDGSLLGTSTRAVGNEHVNLTSANVQFVVMKVYGFAGAVNFDTYGIGLSCNEF